MKLHCAFNRKSKSKSNKYFQQPKENSTKTHKQQYWKTSKKLMAFKST